VFADRAGKIVAVKVGELHRNEADLILDRMHDLDQGRLSLSTAREQIATGIDHLTVRRPPPGGGAAQ